MLISSIDQKQNTVPPAERRLAIVTGANSGIGYEVSRTLARQGLKVVMACRDAEKAESARGAILKEVPEAHVGTQQVDLSSLASVQQFAEKFSARYAKLDLLVNNAGIMMSPYKETADGYENQFATNYLGHFALTGRLLPLLRAALGARVVSLSSLSYKWSDLRFDDIHFERGYDKRKAYGQSKRACLVFAYELDRRLKAHAADVRSVAAHPGLSKTNLDRYFPKLIRPLGGLFLQPAEKGARPVLYAALSDTIEGGEYIGPDGFQEMRGRPTKVDSDEATKRGDIANRLWGISEKLSGVRYLSSG
ncbi:MAG: oxidoreductase [Catalinimonas sp.]